MSNVITAPFHRDKVMELCERIEAVIHEYDGQLTVAEAVGVLEIIKNHIINRE
jgi:hypothetical protein